MLMCLYRYILFVTIIITTQHFMQIFIQRVLINNKDLKHSFIIILKSK